MGKGASLGKEAVLAASGRAGEKSNFFNGLLAGESASLARIIHERFCCNRRSAATTSLRPAGSPLGATGQAPPQMAEPVPRAPRASLATRLSDFATNRHE